MNSQQEYEEIKKAMSKRESDNINKFLERHPRYVLSDVYESPEIHNEFEKWRINHEKIHLSYFKEGLSNNPFIKLSVEDLMNELEDNPKLKQYVLAYAKDNLKENSLFDKAITIRVIETVNTDILYAHDTEVRENFAECFKAGIKSMYADLNEQAKQFKNKSQREDSR